MAAVLCTALPDIGAGTATPAIALINKAMPEVPVSLVQMIVSIPSACLIFFPPVYAALTQRVRKKRLLLAAFLLMLAGSVGPVFADGIYSILFCRFLMGCGNGIIMPITIDLIMDLYEGHEKQSMLGYAATVTSIGGILFQTLGGVMGTIDWHYCFLAAAVSTPCYLFALIFLPDVPLPQNAGDGRTQGGESRGFRMRDCIRLPLAWLAFFMVLWELLYFVFLTNISIYLVNENIATTAQVGVITATVTIAGMLMSALYGTLIKTCHEKILPVAYLVTAMGFVAICVGHTPLLAGAGAFCIGVGYGISAPCQLNLASDLVEKRYTSVATSVCYTARGLGGFISPLVVTAVCSALGQTSALFPFQMAAGTLLVLAGAVSVYLKVFRIKIAA